MKPARLSVFVAVEILLAIGVVSPYNTGVYRVNVAGFSVRVPATVSVFPEAEGRAV